MLLLAVLSLGVGTVLSVSFSLSPLPALIPFPSVSDFFSQNLSYIGISITTYLYLISSGEGDSYIDVDSESVDLEFVAIVSLCIVICLALTLLFNMITSLLGISASVTPVDLSTVRATLPVGLFAATVLFFNAPAEELLFRNVIQKRLEGDSTALISILVSSVIFITLHIPKLGSGGIGIETVAALILLFVVSTVFGATYYLTGSLFAPILTHAAYNLIQLGLSAATVI